MANEPGNGIPAPDAEQIIARLKKSATAIALNVELLQMQLQAAGALLLALEVAIQAERKTP